MSFLPRLAALTLGSVFALAACSKSASEPAGGYKLIPTWKVGDKFGLVAEYSTTTTESFFQSVHFEADGEILALLPNGDPRKVAYTVKTIQIAGTVISPQSKTVKVDQIVIEYPEGGERTVTFDGKPAVHTEVSDTLEGVLWLNNRKHTDQEKFGPKGPMTVGASWPINSQAWLDEDNSHLDRVEGTMKFTAVQNIGNTQIGTIHGNYLLESSLPTPGKPPEKVSEKGEETITFPLNGRGVFRQEFRFELTGPADGPGGRPFVSKDTGFQEVTLH